MSTIGHPIAGVGLLVLGACSNSGLAPDQMTPGTPDTTAPAIGTVGDGVSGDIDSQSSTTTLSANWTGFNDAESGIAFYEFAIGTSPGGVDVQGWTSVGLVESNVVNNVNLQVGGLYFVSVRAHDVAGNVSAVASSDGVAINISVSQSITRHDVTWTFDRAYPIGQFANGDPFVVGPVTITSIDPPSSSSQTPHQNGSMLNPPPRNVGNATLGYDARMAYVSYDSALNVALDVSPSSPLVVPAGSSLVSTVSLAVPTRDQCLKTAAVLTVLDEDPLPNSFRPPYCGTDKTVRFNKGDLDYTLLRSVPGVANTPSLSSITDSVDRVWLDHQGGWVGVSLHPTDNMPGYGRDLSDAMGVAALTLQLDYTQAEKEPLAVCMVQMGIDLFGVVENGGDYHWAPDGGHASGRKFPILLAGLMLDDPDMRDIGFRPGVMFGEDAQTFYVQQTSPGVYNNGHGNYGPADVGMAEWGIRHATHPDLDDRSLGAPYRQCCTANAWTGFVLAARMMGIQAAWNHDALFDYQDRFLTGIGSSQSAWAHAMWNAYRASF